MRGATNHLGGRLHGSACVDDCPVHPALRQDAIRASNAAAIFEIGAGAYNCRTGRRKSEGGTRASKASTGRMLSGSPLPPRTRLTADAVGPRAARAIYVTKMSLCLLAGCHCDGQIGGPSGSRFGGPPVCRLPAWPSPCRVPRAGRVAAFRWHGAFRHCFARSRRAPPRARTGPRG